MLHLRILSAAALVLALAAPAMAGEGQGEPFPNNYTRPITSQTVLSDTTSYTTPIFGATNATVQAATTANSGVLEPISNEAAAETIGSYPAHALDGTVDSAYAAGVTQYFAGQSSPLMVGAQTIAR